jgi:hypothetical protein
MPNIKNSVLRYLLIDNRLRTEPKPGHEELRDYLEEQFAKISKDKHLFTKLTVKKDLKDMRKFFSAPVSFSFQENSYRYEKAAYTFLNLPPAILERITLHLKLQYLWGDRVDENIQIQFEKIPASEGYNYIPIIAEALCQKKALSVKYKAAAAKRSSTLILHPQGVKEHQKKFFLIAAKDKEKELRSYDVTCILEQPVILAKDAFTAKDFSVESFKIESNS